MGPAVQQDTARHHQGRIEFLKLPCIWNKMHQEERRAEDPPPSPWGELQFQGDEQLSGYERESLASGLNA